MTFINEQETRASEKLKAGSLMACTPTRKRGTDWVDVKTLQACHGVLRLQDINLFGVEMWKKFCSRKCNNGQRGLLTFQEMWDNINRGKKNVSTSDKIKKCVAKYGTGRAKWEDLVCTDIERGWQVEGVEENLVARIVGQPLQIGKGKFEVPMKNNGIVWYALVQLKYWGGLERKTIECLFRQEEEVEVRVKTLCMENGKIRKKIRAISVYSDTGKKNQSLEKTEYIEENKVPRKRECQHVAFEREEVHMLISRMIDQRDLFQRQVKDVDISGKYEQRVVCSQENFDSLCSLYNEYIASLKICYEIDSVNLVHPLCHVLALDLVMKYMTMTTLIRDDVDKEVQFSPFIPLCAFSIAIKFFGAGLNGRHCFKKKPWCNIEEDKSCVLVDDGLLIRWILNTEKAMNIKNKWRQGQETISQRDFTEWEYWIMGVLNWNIHFTPLDLVYEIACKDKNSHGEQIFVKSAFFLQKHYTSSEMFLLDTCILGLALTNLYSKECSEDIYDFSGFLLLNFFEREDVNNCWRVIALKK